MLALGYTPVLLSNQFPSRSTGNYYSAFCLYSVLLTLLNFMEMNNKTHFLWLAFSIYHIFCCYSCINYYPCLLLSGNLLHSLFSWWTFELLLVFRYFKKCFCVPLWEVFVPILSIIFLKLQSRKVGSYGGFMLNFLINMQTVVHSGFTFHILSSSVWTLSFLQITPTLSAVIFLIVDILIGRYYYHTVVVSRL